MSKVICDVCGTTYPETATQCPICGSAKNNASQTLAGSEAGQSSEGYARVRGGRFSKKNVRKMSSGAVATTARRRSGSSRNVQEGNEPNNTGLVIVIILLVLAILATLAYIVVKNMDFSNPEDTNPPKQSDPAPTDGSDPTVNDIPCTDLQLSNNILELKVGETWSLKTQLTPENTTDEVLFESSDDNIVKISDTGEIMMVGEGEATITVTCGNQSAVCTVKSPNLVTEPSLPPFTLSINASFFLDNGVGDVMLFSQGETWQFYKSGSLSVDIAYIVWTSDDPSVAIIENGVVTAVGPGTTKVHATCNGTTYSAFVRCNFEVQENACTIYMSEGGVMKEKKDVTISVGESVTVALRDTENATVEVTWICDDGGVTIEGNTVTGAEPGNHTVYCEYEGVTYKCTVRVKKPADAE